MSPLTDTQREVVTRLGANFCVTSGAGCGKTRVLVERYMHLLRQDPTLSLSRLAAITFTENAAAEMRSRIRDACLEHVVQARRDGDAARLRTWLQRYWDVDVAPVSTIHSFASTLLRHWPIEAGVDPNFVLADEVQTAFLQRDAVAATLERLLEADNADVLTLLEHFQPDEAQAVLEEFLGGYQDRLERVAAPVMAMSDEEILTRLKQRVDEVVVECLRAAADSEDVQRARTVLTRYTGDASDRIEAVRAEVIAQLERFENARTADIALAAIDKLLSAINLQGGRVNAWPDAEVLADVKDALKALRGAFQDALKGLPRFNKEAERQHLAVARALYRIARAVQRAYEAAKRKRSALDFEDLQTRVRDLLRRHPRVRDNLRRRFRAILVDELQDTNFLQFELVHLLTAEPGAEGPDAPLRPGALFAVGDPKQSIYRFRGAEVEVFADALSRVPEAGRRALQQSFRLHPGTAALVNRVFARLMGDAYEAIEGVAPQANTVIAELHHVTAADDGDAGMTAEDGYAAEARVLAARLRRIVSDGEVQVWDRQAGAARPARYGDVAVLLRRTTYLHLFEHALEAEGVPYYVVAGRGFYRQQEVLDVVHLLRVLEDPTDDLHLAGVLRSPFFAVSDEALYRLHLLAPTLHEALPRAAEAQAMDAEDLRGLRRAAERLAEWAAMKDALPLGSLVDRVVFESGYAAASVGRFGGERAYANLRQMVSLARRFEASGLWSLSDYVEYVTDVMQSEMHAEQAPVEVPGADAVRLMTVHKAKGLEFPVVAVPDLGYAPAGPTSPWMIHPATGLAVRTRDDDGDRTASAALALARHEEADALQAESHRLLYVAMTRTQDYLIFISHDPKRTRHKGRRWLDGLTQSLGIDLEAGTGEVVLDGTGRVTVHVGPAPRREARHGRRRGGPKDVFQAGRVAWHRLRERPGRADTVAAKRRLAQVTDLALAPHPPRRIAATALATFSRCPRRHWWAHVQGVSRVEPARDKALSASALGTLAHRALELSPSPKPEAVRQAVAVALADADLTPDERGPVADRLAEQINIFWRGPLGRRVAAAARVLRELPFVLAIDGTEIHGKMDLLFQDADGSWEVVDYKSSTPPPAGEAALAEAYALQVGLYALAAGRALGQPVARMGLYFLGNGAYHGQPATPQKLEGIYTRAKEMLAQIPLPWYIHNVSVGVCRGCEFARACLANRDEVRDP